MGQIYRFLGLTVGVIQHDLPDAERQARLRLRHHLRHQQRVRLRLPARQHEVRARGDGAARPPLRHRRRGRLDPDRRGAHAADHLRPGRGVDRQVLPDRPHHPAPGHGRGDRRGARQEDAPPATTWSTRRRSRRALDRRGGREGREAASASGTSTTRTNMEILHHVNQALRAHTLYKRDVDYVVKDGEVIIVDEFTGRLMPGRRWSDGLHQAVEAKEGVKIERENQTLATITFQNYFRMYKKLAGMTGTADTEAAEFDKIYKLDVVVIPTNRAMVRDDPRRRLQDRAARSSTRSSRRSARLQREGPAGPGRHGLDREERDALEAAQAAAQGAARRAQRQVPRARGRRSSRRPGARARSPSPPTWPAAAPTSCSAATPRGWPAPRPIRRPRPRPIRRRSSATRRSAPASARRCSSARRPPHPRHRAARVAAHRQPAARPRRPPGRPGSSASTSRSKTT